MLDIVIFANISWIYSSLDMFRICFKSSCYETLHCVEDCGIMRFMHCKYIHLSLPKGWDPCTLHIGCTQCNLTANKLLNEGKLQDEL